MKKIIKCLVMGFVAMGFVACDSVSGVFDKFSYDEVFDSVSYRKERFCSECERNALTTFGICGKFIPPSELADEEKGLIGVCEYTRFAEGGYLHYKNDKLKEECKTGIKKGGESGTGLVKVDKKSGALLIENKYKIIDIVESAEYGVDKYGQGFCKIRKIYKLKRGQPKE